MKNIIIDILKKQTNVDSKAWDILGDDDDLTQFGFNSLVVIKVDIALEDRFQFTLDDNDLLMDNFTTINKIINLLKKYDGEDHESV